VYSSFTSYSRNKSGKEEVIHKQISDSKVISDIHATSTDKRKRYNVEDKKQKRHFTMPKEEVHKMISARPLNTMFVMPFVSAPSITIKKGG
jgi:hypothetical protein